MKAATTLGRVFLCLAVLLGLTQLETLAANGEGKSGAKKLTKKEQKKQNTLWRQVPDDTIASRGKREFTPEKYLVFRLNQKALHKALAQAPLEFTEEARQKQFVMELILFRHQSNWLITSRSAAI